jgi:hypothetical protein
MEACGIDVFKTARRNGFQIDTCKDNDGKWSFFSMVLIEYNPDLHPASFTGQRVGQWLSYPCGF